MLFLLFINDICDKLKYSNFLLYADDIKLFCKISSPLDQSKFQVDLDTITEWTKVNDLSLNVDKCSLLTFHRGDFFKTNYIINGSPLVRVTEQKDLGIIFQENFEFNTHLNTTINKAFKILGFIIRSSTKFNCDTIIYLYKTIVRPILLYNSSIWTPSYAIHIKKLESIQHKFFRHLAFRMGTPFSIDEHDYEVFARGVKLNSIKSLHNYYDLLFIRKTLCLNSTTNCAISNIFVTREIRFNTRNPRELLEVHTNKDYVFHSPSFRLRRMYNNLGSNVKTCDNMCDFKNALFDVVCEFK